MLDAEVRCSFDVFAALIEACCKSPSRTSFFFRPEIEDKDNETLATTVLTVVTSEGVLVQNTEDDMRK